MAPVSPSGINNRSIQRITIDRIWEGWRSREEDGGGGEWEKYDM